VFFLRWFTEITALTPCILLLGSDLDSSEKVGRM
jgi:hypothetical protein